VWTGAFSTLPLLRIVGALRRQCHVDCVTAGECNAVVTHGTLQLRQWLKICFENQMARIDEAKTAFLNLRIRPSIKALAELCAAQDRRSLTQYLELLIEADAERRGVQKPS
jgi:hypothetical protein